MFLKETWSENKRAAWCESVSSLISTQPTTVILSWSGSRAPCPEINTRSMMACSLNPTSLRLPLPCSVAWLTPVSMRDPAIRSSPFSRFSSCSPLCSASGAALWVFRDHRSQLPGRILSSCPIKLSQAALSWLALQSHLANRHSWLLKPVAACLQSWRWNEWNLLFWADTWSQLLN